MFKPASFLLPVDTSERVTLVPIFYFIKNQASAPPFLLSAKGHVYAGDTKIHQKVKIIP